MLKIPKFVFKLRKLDTQSDFNHLLPEKIRNLSSLLQNLLDFAEILCKN